jgi:small-conductance mechanosensitive channel
LHSASNLLIENALCGALILIAAVVIAQLAHYLLYSLLRRVQAWRGGPSSEIVLRFTSKSSQAILILVTLTIAYSTIRSTNVETGTVEHVLQVGYIAAFAWLLISFIEIGDALIVRRLPKDTQDDVRARSVQTQVDLLRQFAVWIVVFIAFAAILMTFPSIRNIGAGLFASAGVAGLVLGMAARPTLGNLIAGIQIALSQPIRIGDSVVVDGQFGRSLEINTTYVVIRLWDLRHLIVPISHFIEKSFENWTRYSSDLIGAVYLQMDWTVPFETLREHYGKILADSSLWDGKTSTMQVTEWTHSTVEIRFLMGAQIASAAFDLRCYVREKMLSYLQKEYPQSLPKVRTEASFTGKADPQLSTFSNDQGLQ